MVAVAFILLWSGYSTGLWGWCLFRDYDVTFGQLVSPAHPYSGPWPPPLIPSSQTWPGAAPSKAPGTATPGQAPPAKAGSGIAGYYWDAQKAVWLPVSNAAKGILKRLGF